MSKIRAVVGAVFLLAIAVSPVAATHSGDLDCPDLGTQAEAQAHWDDHGYSAGNDPERLDADDDGIPCEDPNDDEEAAGGGGGGMPGTDTIDDVAAATGGSTTMPVLLAVNALLGAAALMALRLRRTDR